MDEAALLDHLHRIATALETYVAQHKDMISRCVTCDGSGRRIVSVEKKDSMGIERDFTGVDLVPFDKTLRPLDFDFVNARVVCFDCRGTGRQALVDHALADVWNT